MTYKQLFHTLSNSDLHNLISEAIKELVHRAHTRVGQAAVNTGKLKKWELALQLIKDGFSQDTAYKAVKGVK